ncbi:MAG TPA: CoA-binding protein [Alphaproteobacteria bacterium]|nr:CoA-binding protein [Alphaproteobacteria bacterium]
MNHDSYPDDYLRDIFRTVKTIAVVGASTDPSRASNYVMAFLQRQGYRCIPVNPTAAGETINGETVRASLRDVPEKIDMVDIFRRSEQAGAVADEAVELGIPVIWMQMGIRNDEAAKRAEAKGARVVMDRCPKVDYPRLMM